MDANIVALLYLAAGVLFILALRGLSSPETSRQGNFYGMIGMAIAVLTTLTALGEHSFMTWALIIVGVGIGGGGEPDDGTRSVARSYRRSASRRWKVEDASPNAVMPSFSRL